MFGLLGWQARLGEASLIIALLVGAYFYVHHKGYSEAMQEVATAQETADKKQREKYDKLAQELEDTKKKRQENAKIVTKYVKEIIDRPIYTSVPCIDSDGLRIINEAIKGGGISKPPSAVSENSEIE